MIPEEKIEPFMHAPLGKEIGETGLNNKINELKNLAFEEWVQLTRYEYCKLGSDGGPLSYESA